MKYLFLVSVCLLAAMVRGDTATPTERTLKQDQHLEDVQKRRDRDARRARALALMALVEKVADDPHAFRVLCGVKRFHFCIERDGKTRDVGITIDDTDLVKRLLAAEEAFDAHLESKE